jgi:hypothetical protein
VLQMTVSIPRRVLMLTLACVLTVTGVGATAGVAVAAPPNGISGVDITSTSAGQAAAALAAQQLTSAGHPTTAASLTVFREQDGTLTAIPKGMKRVVGTRPDGSVGAGVVLDASRLAPASSIQSGISPADAQYWNQINNGCFWTSKSQGWMYPCYTLGKMYNDGYNYNDFFLLRFDGLARSNGNGMHTAYVEVTRNSASSPLTMTDFAPRQNLYLNCTQYTLSVSYVFGFSAPVTVCEDWFWYADPVNNPGLQQTQWWSMSTIYNDGRDPTLFQEVETAENARPIWNLYWDFQ